LPDAAGKSERKFAMRALLTVLASTFIVTACSAPGDETPGASASSGAPASAPASAAATGDSAVTARNEKVSNDLYEFEYAYPAAAAAIPDLRAWLDADLDKQRSDLIAEAKEQREDRKANDFPYHPLGYWATWKVVTDLPGWLSLSGSVSTYQGGAHPNHGFDSLVWDRQANMRRDPDDLFTSEAALSRAIRTDFCRELDKQRAKKRGEPIPPNSDDMFDECIDPMKSTLILGSSNGKAFDRLGILVAPYEAGPYAEGAYEVTLPVTDAVLATVKPEFRATFAKAR
jgi:hypothetical protein